LLLRRFEIDHFPRSASGDSKAVIVSVTSAAGPANDVVNGNAINIHGETVLIMAEKPRNIGFGTRNFFFFFVFPHFGSISSNFIAWSLSTWQRNAAHLGEHAMKDVEGRV